MKVLQIDTLEVQLIGNQAYIYSETSSDVLNIPGIEDNPDAESIIISELEQLSSSFSSQAIALFD